MKLKGRGVLAVLLIWSAVESVTGRISEDEVLPARRADSELAEQIAVTYLGDNFAMSLVSKEFLDFLLTPALMVQESISENVIITYPSE